MAEVSLVKLPSYDCHLTILMTAPSHYLNQCWPRSLPPYGVTRPQWVKGNIESFLDFLQYINIRLLEYNDLFILPWLLMTWPGGARTQDISSHGIDLLTPEYFASAHKGLICWHWHHTNAYTNTALNVAKLDLNLGPVGTWIIIFFKQFKTPKKENHRNGTSKFNSKC